MNLLSIAQIAISILIIALILIQERSSGISGIFGGGESGEFYQTRRGLEKIVFIATIVLMILFAGLSLLNFLI